MKNKTIMDMQPEQRPDEKFLAFGPEALTDAELLAIILRTGTKDETSIELAERILCPQENPDGTILSVHNLDLEDLQKVKGIGKVKALKIKAVAELSRRIAMTRAEEKLDFSNPETIASYYMEQVRHFRRERVILVLLDSTCKKIRDVTISLGTVNASLFSPREILQEALKYDAVNIVLLHNHPSGDPTPSKHDIKATTRIKKACDIVGIPLLDHIVIGDQLYCSMKEEGYLK